MYVCRESEGERERERRTCVCIYKGFSKIESLDQKFQNLLFFEWRLADSSLTRRGTQYLILGNGRLTIFMMMSVIKRRRQNNNKKKKISSKHTFLFLYYDLLLFSHTHTKKEKRREESIDVVSDQFQSFSSSHKNLFS